MVGRLQDVNEKFGDEHKLLMDPGLNGIACTVKHVLGGDLILAILMVKTKWATI